MARYQLKPHLDTKKNGKWRLNVPAEISPTGKRQRLWFDSHAQALGAANKFRQHHDQFGLSSRMLPPGRLIEATECWELLDSQATAPPGSLRRIVFAALKVRKERAKSITLAALFDDYTAKLRRNHKSENYIRQFSWCRGYFASTAFLKEKVSDLTPSEIKAAFQHLPSGNFNSNLRLIRAVLNHGVKGEYLAKNPALQIEPIARTRGEIRPLPNEIVRAMFADARANAPELLPAYTIGFFTGCREAEISKLKWSDVRLDGERSFVLVRPEVSKTRRKRFPPLPANALEWLDLYFRLSGQAFTPDSQEPVLSLTPKQMRLTRERNYRAATNSATAKWPANCKRRTFATNWVAAFEDLDKLALILGHTSVETSFSHYVGGTTRALGLAYFEIRP